MVVSVTLFRRNETAVVAASPRPVIVRVRLEPAVAEPGVTPVTTGSTVTDTTAVFAKAGAEPANWTLTTLVTLLSTTAGGAANATLSERVAAYSGPAARTVTWADAVSVGSSWCVPMIVSVGGTGMKAGAV